MRTCKRCKKAPTKTQHFNCKYCDKCRRYYLSHPKSTLTKAQIKRAHQLRGKISRDDIAKKLGVSLANLKRAMPGVRLAYHNKYVINPGLVKRVCAYYEKHGRPKTEKAFPGVKVRSIVEHYKDYKPRQVRWTGEQMIEAARMAGVIDFRSQAKFFKRPRAHEGSIKSLWMKRFGQGGGTVNGMSHWLAKEIVTEECPFITSRYWSTRRYRKDFSRKLFLWTDMESHLKRGVPKFIRDAVKASAEFQRKLYGTNKPRPVILKMIRERTHG